MGRGESTAEYALEKLLLLVKIAADWVRHQIPTAKAIRDLIAVPIYQDKTFGLPNGKGVQQHLIDQRVDGSRGSNAEHEREHGGNTEGRHPEKRACGEAEIVSEIPQPSSQPDVSHFLFDLRDAP